MADFTSKWLADMRRNPRVLLDRIADHPINRIGELAPWNLRPNAA